MKLERDFCWLKDSRMVAVAVGCVIAGFLLGLLVFGKPWHLPPAWGDIPTWLLALFAAIAGWVGFAQLRTLRQQLGDEIERNTKRDQLIDKQLDEAERRATAERRMQAEDVEVTWSRDSASVIGIVRNRSRRPISGISCKVMSNVDLKVIKLPAKSGEQFDASFAGGSEMHFTPELKPLQVFETLRPQASCAFIFEELPTAPDQVVVAWFTDDAGFRWQLDEYLHLVEVRARRLSRTTQAKRQRRARW